MNLALARKVFRRYRSLKESLRSCKSPTGAMLDSARTGTIACDGGSTHALEDLHLELAHLTYLFEHLLTRKELKAFIGLETPRSHTARCARVTGDKRCDCGALFYYERSVRNGELVLTVSDGDMPVQATRHGEIYIGPVRYPKDHDRAGEVVDGWSRVAGDKPVYPTWGAVRRKLRMTEWEFRSLLDSVSDAVSKHMRGDPLTEL